MSTQPYPLQLADSRADWDETQKRLKRTWAFVMRNHRFEWPEVGLETRPLPEEPQEATGKRILIFRARGDKPTNIA